MGLNVFEIYSMVWQIMIQTDY